MTHSRLWNITLGVALAAVLVVALTACATSPLVPGGSTATTGVSSSTGPRSATITEQNFKFDPSTLAVGMGDTVSFSNQDTVAHHVVVGTTDLGVQQPGTTVTWTASQDGTFALKCLIHPSMTGQITVGVAGSATSTGGGTGGTGSSGAGGGTSSSSGGAGGGPGYSY